MFIKVVHYDIKVVIFSTYMFLQRHIHFHSELCISCMYSAFTVRAKAKLMVKLS